MLQQANPEARVLTIVFYHCAGVGGIGYRRYRLEFHQYLIHSIGYWSVGLGDLDAEAYLERDNPAGWGLAPWMRQRREGRAELRLRLFEKILRFVGDESYRRLLLDAVQTYLRLNRREQAEEQRLLQTRGYGEIGEMLNTVLGRMEERARQEGRQEGATEALQRGLIGIIQSRFGAVPDRLAAQIRDIQDPDLLDELVRRAAVATSMEEVARLLAERIGDTP